jgi:hypothetical protein
VGAPKVPPFAVELEGNQQSKQAKRQKPEARSRGGSWFHFMNITWQPPPPQLLLLLSLLLLLLPNLRFQFAHILAATVHICS